MTETLLPEGRLSWGERRTEYEKRIDAEIKARVQRGLAWLEEKHGPGWEAKIDLGTLNLQSGDHCVLGQLYREPAHKEEMDGYTYALYEFGVMTADEYEDLEVISCGFCALDGSDWPRLQKEWERVLAG